MEKTMIGCRIRNDNFNRLVKLAPAVGTNPTNLAVTVLDEVIPDLTYLRLRQDITNADMRQMRVKGILIMYDNSKTYALCMNDLQREYLEDLYHEKGKVISVSD